uniref:Uncharacterized protein n=1 Tax=Brassica campestris TaxID=3711 RepID=M4FFN4_BRACM
MFSLMSLGEVEEEKLCAGSFPATHRPWLGSSGVASSLDGRPVFGYGVHAFFSGIGLPTQVFPVTVSSVRISVSGVASILGERPAFASGALTFFSGVGRPALVSVSRSSLVVMAVLSNLPDYGLDLRSSDRLEFSEDRSGWMVLLRQGSVRRSFFQPLPFRWRMTALHRLDACPLVAGQPNTWWTRWAFFFIGLSLWALGS